MDESPFFSLEPDGIKVQIHALPGAARSAAAGISAGRLRVKVAARAQDGAANKRLIEWIASRLGVSKSSVTLLRGDKSRDKALFIAGDPQILSEKARALSAE